MADKRKVIFRGDGNSVIGLGHLYRLLALASRLDTSFEKQFVIQKSEQNIYDLIESQSSKLIVLPISSDLHVEYDLWISQLSGDEIVVLDGYKFDAAFQKKIKEKGCYLFFLDDIHSFHYYADIIINVGTDQLDDLYPNKEFYTQLKGGFPYAFLRKSFDATAKNTITHTLPNKSGILVCLGGADPNNQIEEIYAKTRSIFPQEKIHIVVGSAYLQIESLKKNTIGDESLQIHHNINENAMVRLMSSCEMGICSASTVSYEFLTTGGTLFLFKTAENQSNIYQYLIAHHLAFPFEQLGVSVTADQAVLRQMLKSYLENDYNKIFHRISEEKSYTLRKADVNDVKTIFDWINEPITRQQSTNPAPIIWENHENWFNQKVNSDNTLMLILCKNETPVGQIRFDRMEEHVLISFLVDANNRGKGLGNLLLKLGVQYYKFHISRIDRIAGFVRPENIASLKAFRKNQFTEENAIENGMELVKFTLYK